MRESRTMPAPARLVTAEDLLRMPDDGPYTYELVRGRLIRMSRPGARHSRVSMLLGSALNEFVEQRRLGIVLAQDAGFKLESQPDTVRGPDVSFVRRERIEATGIPDGYWPGPPDLAVEVLSPNDRPAEVKAKIDQYLQLGVRMVWLVAPRKRTLTVYRPGMAPVTLTAEQEVDGTDVVPGFRFRIARLFEFP